MTTGWRVDENMSMTSQTNLEEAQRAVLCPACQSNKDALQFELELAIDEYESSMVARHDWSPND